MLLILRDAIDDLSPYVDNGSCNEAKVISRLNEATRRLLERPNTPVNTTRFLKYCTKQNLISLPREAEKILWADINGTPSLVLDMPYEFLSDGPGMLTSYGDTWRPYVVDMGDGHPTFFEIPSIVVDEDDDDPPDNSCESLVHTPLKLIAVSTEASDRALSIRILGKDSLSADILTDGIPGEVLQIGQWENGVEGTLNKQDFPPITENAFMNVGGLIKPVTKGYVSLYTYDEDTNRMYFLAKYHPDETRPNYRWYRLTAPCEEGQCIQLLVKLRYVAAKHDNDILLIQNLGALKYMVMAISRENEREFDEAQAYEAKALQILRDQHSNNKNYFPQFQVQRCSGFRGVNIV